MAAVPLMVGGLSTSASAADGINILDNVKLNAEIRPRYEYADVKNNGVDKGQAFTARTKLSVSAGLLGVDGLSANVGVISVNNFGWNKYDSKSPYYNPGSGKYDVIVDPQQAMLANAEVTYKVGKTLLHAGRGQVNLDNQRFIGTVGWRQLERSYDSVFVANNSVKNLSLLAAWVYGAQGVKAGATADANTILLHAAYTVMPELKITAYDYMVAVNHPVLTTYGSDTYGIALTGKANIGAKLTYRAEYALQKDASMKLHGIKGKADADYFNIDIGANVSGILIGANYELLSGSTGTDGKTNFIPALGTNHKFNGWADHFYVADTGPSGGLQDMNIRLGYKAKGVGKLLAVYHQFTADKKMGGEDDLGTEIDALYANKIPGVNNLKGLLKGAFYKAGKVSGYTKDVNKFWVMLDYKFATK